MLLHRISPKAFAGTPEEAFGGKGGLFASGRWSTKGRPVVYASEHLSLAMAEVLVHLQRTSGLVDFVRWEIELPSRHIKELAELPKEWPALLAETRRLGDAWLAGGSSVALRIPSVLAPGEFNCLLNPLHRHFDFDWIRSGPVEFRFDHRLVR